MKTIVVTKQNPDGTYDSVGMNNRRLIHLKTQRGVVNRVKRTGFARTGDKLRLEWFHRTYDERPYHTGHVIIGGWGDIE